MISGQICRRFLGLVLLGLVGCGGGGDGGPGDSRPPSKLFVVDSPNRAVGSQIDSNPAAGTLPMDRVVTGPDTDLDMSVTNLPSLALDAAGDRIYVATQLSALVWHNAGLADGNVRRSRIIVSNVPVTGPFGTFERAVNFAHLFIDTVNDRLYVAETIGQVLVFSNASSVNLVVTPSRTIMPSIGSTISGTFGIAVDLARNLLYVGVVSGSSSILVFNDADTLNSASATPARKLDSASGLGAFFLDAANDRLYLAQSAGAIEVFDNASALATGALPAPNRTITLGTTQKYIFVEPTNNRLYAVSGNRIFIVNSVSTAADPVTATALTVPTPGSQFLAVAAKP